MAVDIKKIISQIAGMAIPEQTYTVGGKSSPGLPVDVRLKLDPQMEKTILKTAGIVAGGLAIGVAVGLIVTHRK
jgi:hypothetical protein